MKDKPIIQGTSDLTICGYCHEAYDTPERARACDCADEAGNDLALAESQRALSRLILGEMGDMD